MKVYIVGSNGRCAYANMYRDKGFTVTQDVEKADVVQFTGGEDVSPDRYGCGAHPATRNNVHRDAEEANVFERCRGLGIPMVGICRGGQFLNVMSGGKMFQDVDGHGLFDTHKLVDEHSGFVCDATSTHHQMMIAGKHGRVIGVATPTLTTHKDYVDGDGDMYVVTPEEGDFDTEVVYYPDHLALCFQPHPEYDNGVGCRPYFFALLYGYLLNQWDHYRDLTGTIPMNHFLGDPVLAEEFEDEDEDDWEE